MFLTCNARSAALGRGVTFHVVLPDGGTEFPTLYLLHGLSDDASAWHRYTSVCRYAENRGLAVVMPDGETSFYTDTAGGEAYFTYVAKELPELTRRILPLSHDRERTFIGGNSMGGYGAFKSALTFPETFGRAFAFSGALDIVSLVRNADWMQELSRRNWGKECHETIRNSSGDLEALLAGLAADSARSRPALLQICGTEDFLYRENREFRHWAESVPGLPFEYREGPGAHTWDFWDARLPEAMDWLLAEVRHA